MKERVEGDLFLVVFFICIIFGLVVSRSGCRSPSLLLCYTTAVSLSYRLSEGGVRRSKKRREEERGEKGEKRKEKKERGRQVF